MPRYLLTAFALTVVTGAVAPLANAAEPEAISSQQSRHSVVEQESTAIATAQPIQAVQAVQNTGSAWPAPVAPLARAIEDSQRIQLEPSNTPSDAVEIFRFRI
ncbi:MAG: hypothetical protein AAF152_07570 [Cyanobacteria bacterium P01_A01_bin.114]